MTQKVAMVLGMVVALVACNDDEDKATYALDAETSVVEWHGAGNSAEHDGSFAVESTSLQTEDGRITGGTFSIPIASIKNFDLPEEVKPVLLDHLKTVDFFNLAVYPTASFEIISVTSYDGDDEEGIEGANVKVKGNFTLIGKSLPIEFPAKVVFTDDTFTAEAELTIDRTLWGMTYSADPALGEHYIFPDVDLALHLKGKKK